MLSVRKMKAVSLIGKGSQNLTCFVYYLYEINSKIFLLSRHFYSWAVVLDLDKNIFCWQTCFIWERGLHLKSQSSFIPVNTIHNSYVTLHSQTTVLVLNYVHNTYNTLNISCLHILAPWTLCGLEKQ